jgi:protein SCO1/2
MILLGRLACGGSDRQEVAATAAAPPCHEELPPAASAAGSLYELALPLQTASGASAGLDLHRGHPVLIAMFYGTCTQACPLTVAKLRSIEAALPEAQRREMRVLLVSLDPARDTPAAMARLGARHGLDARWTLARTEDEHVRELAAALGVKYRALPDGEINHSAVITLLDGAGVPQARLESLSAPIESMVAAAAGLRRS